MGALIAFNWVPLAACAAIGFVTGLWIFRGGGSEKRP